jgi:hypothetical protein
MNWKVITKSLLDGDFLALLAVVTTLMYMTTTVGMLLSNWSLWQSIREQLW